jgi:hypothetical protein
LHPQHPQNYPQHPQNCPQHPQAADLPLPATLRIHYTAAISWLQAESEYMSFFFTIGKQVNAVPAALSASSAASAELASASSFALASTESPRMLELPALLPG